MRNDDYNLALLCDFYELTMGRGYFNTPMRDRIAYFDVFYRRVPDGGGLPRAGIKPPVLAVWEDPERTEKALCVRVGRG